jgi:hypothetical protein
MLVLLGHEASPIPAQILNVDREKAVLFFYNVDQRIQEYQDHLSTMSKIAINTNAAQCSSDNLLNVIEQMRPFIESNIEDEGQV